MKIFTRSGLIARVALLTQNRRFAKSRHKRQFSARLRFEALEDRLLLTNTPPTITNLGVSPSSLTAGKFSTVSGSFSDPDVANTHTVVINWGLGQVATTILDSSLTDCGDGDPTTKCFSASHQYQDANQYNVTATVIDDDGGTGGTAQFAYAVGFGSIGVDSGQKIAADGAGNVYVTGLIQGTVDFDPGPATVNLTSAGGSNIFVSKFDSTGAFLWARAMGGPGGFDLGFDLAVDGAGNVYTTGRFSDTADFDPGPNTFNLTSAGNGQAGRDGFVSTLFQSLLVTVNPPSDTDGVADAVEDAAPNGGDGNGDGIPDSQQSEVTSLPNSEDQQYVTLASPVGTNLVGVAATPNPSPTDSPAGVDFPFGHLTFAVENLGTGSATTVTLYLPDDTLVNTYYKYGPTSDDPIPHWYEFLFDGVTGAEIFAGPDADADPEIIVLHFLDGQRGDDDLSANGKVHDPGSPAFRPNLPPVANAGGPYMIAEGGSVVLSGAGSSDPNQAADTLTYQWDLDNDGTFGETGVLAEHGNEVGVAPTFVAGTLDGPSVWPISLRVTDDGSLSNTNPTTISITNVAPVLDTLLAISVDENGTVHLTGTYHDVGTQDTHTLTINWGEGAPETVPVTGGSFDIPHQYLDDNPTNTASDVYTIGVTLTDDDTGTDTDSTTATITNVAPVVSPLTGPSAGVQGAWASFTGVRGQEQDFSASFTDAGTLDMHEVSWNFGDGTIIPFHASTDPGALLASHVFTTSDTYTVTLTVRDDDLGTTSSSRSIVIGAFELQPDPCDTTKTALVVGGTAGNDQIVISPGPHPGELRVTVNGVSQSFVAPAGAPFGRIVVFGNAGNDDIQVAGSITLPAWLRGGPGDDRLKGGDGHDVLLGEEGDDLLVGGGGRDLLIGGVGTDRIVGNGGDDILVAGKTDYDANDAALCAIMAEWTSGRDYNTRVKNLLDGTGSIDRQNGPFLLNDATVHDDGVQDVLTGSEGQDWFLFNQDGDNGATKDKVTDLGAREFASDIDFINGS